MLRVVPNLTRLLDGASLLLLNMEWRPGAVGVPRTSNWPCGPLLLR